MTKSGSIDRYILDAARSLLSEGERDFTMEQLAAKANVSRATIYRRVGNKEMLLKRLSHERGETFEQLDTRLRILKAARVVFGREGLAAATMEQIAKKAGVGVATVYRHFGDKENLIRAFLEEVGPKTTIRALALHPTDDVAHDLEEIVRLIMAFFYEHRDILRLVFMGNETERRYLQNLSQGSDTLLSLLTNYFRRQLDAGRLQNVGEPAELALALIGLILAFAIIGPSHYGIEVESLEHASNLIVTIFLNNLQR